MKCGRWKTNIFSLELEHVHQCHHFTTGWTLCGPYMHLQPKEVCWQVVFMEELQPKSHIFDAKTRLRLEAIFIKKYALFMWWGSKKIIIFKKWCFPSKWRKLYFKDVIYKALKENSRFKKALEVALIIFTRLWSFISKRENEKIVTN